MMNGTSFQPYLDRLTHLIIQSNTFNKLNSLYCLDKKIKFILNNSFCVGHLEINIRNDIVQLLQPFYDLIPDHGKSQILAQEGKDKGSKAYLRKQDREALKLYTDALLVSENEDPITSLLYANRSAVLFKLGLYKECLADIELAKLSGYPPDLQYKLWIREISSHLKLSDFSSAHLSLENAKCLISTLPLELHDKVKKSLDVFQCDIKKLSVAHNEEKMFKLHDTPQLFVGESAEVLSMSSALSMRVNSTEGRHITANETIPRGKTVFMERPFAAILLPDLFFSHCQGCFKEVINPVPCIQCRDVVWCSLVCRTRSWSWHQYECRLLHILTSVGIAHLALRVVLVAGWETCLNISLEALSSDIIKHEHKVFETKSFSQLSPEDKYRSAFSLLTHLDKALPEDQLQYALAAVLLSQTISDQTTFIPTPNSELGNPSCQNGHLHINSSDLAFPQEFLESFCELDLNKKESPPIHKENQIQESCLVSMSSVIMYHIAQLVLNAHAITQVVTDNNGVVGGVLDVSQQRIASAIYPAASLMNHSCKPSIINSFHGDLLVIHTLMDIASGEQIYNCYGPHYSRQERERRQEVLQRQYFFCCKCAPCIDSEYKLKEAKWSGLVCESCRGVATWREEEEGGILECHECCKKLPPTPSLNQKCIMVNRLYQEGEALLLGNHFEAAADVLEKALCQGVSLYVEGNQFLNSLRDLLAKSFALAGDYQKALSHLKIGVLIIGLRYGRESVEVGHECLKIRDILLLAQEKDKRLKLELKEMEERIHTIFTVNYGTYWKKYLRIDISNDS